MSLIYKCIPALSPSSSAIYQRFATSSAATVSVSGLSNVEWDDCLVRVSVTGRIALCLTASDLYLAVASDRPRGNITLWDTNLFQKCKAFSVGEPIQSLVFNNSGSMLACYGLSQTYVWKVEDWSLVLAPKNPPDERAIEFTFDDDDSLMMVTDLSQVYKLSTLANTEASCWVQLSPTLLQMTGPEQIFVGTPSSVSFNSDCTQVAVAYRAVPLSIWRLNPPEMIARLNPRVRQGQGTSANSHTGTNKVV